MNPVTPKKKKRFKTILKSYLDGEEVVIFADQGRLEDCRRPGEILPDTTRLLPNVYPIFSCSPQFVFKQIMNRYIWIYFNRREPIHISHVSGKLRAKLNASKNL